MIKLYLRNADAALLVFDLTNPNPNLEEWVTKIYENTTNNSDPLVLFIVGNKSDLESQRAVDYNEMQRIAQKNNATYLEVSAK
jgi:GTPase SAR1 family protein